MFLFQGTQPVSLMNNINGRQFLRKLTGAMVGAITFQQ
jgi:hypothetical protein